VTGPGDRDTIDASSKGTTAAERSATYAGSPSHQPERGDSIGRYVVLSRIGAGAMGVVFAAYDPELDRKVAIKLLQSARGDPAAARARLQREAQALARLNHPNVVAVHDVGVHDDRVFVAMEFVEGRTLGAWMAERRSWREVVKVFEAGGRGLAAAHREGLIHRDFKPDNVMLGDDGRVRVMDFGLARAGEDEKQPALESSAAGAPDSSVLGTTLTRTGALLGTPAYMAPEQLSGLEITAKSDQFGFCVALFEALYGARPFRGETLAALAFNIQQGKIIEAPRADAPRWLHRIVLRGLSTDPNMRFPAMEVLLGELGGGELRRRRGLLLAGIATSGVVAAAIAGGLELDEQRRIATCRAEGAEIDEFWSERARVDVREGLLQSGAAGADVAADRVIPWLDRHAVAWAEARAGACLKAVIAHEWSAEMLDRSRWCLDERRFEFAALAGELQAAKRETASEAVQAAAGLRRVDPCLDERHLAQLPAPPEEQREAIRSVRMDLAKVVALEATADSRTGLELARSTLERAEALGWPPLVAATRLRVGKLLDIARQHEAAEASLEQAYFEAARAGSAEDAHATATNLVYTVGYAQARFEDGLRWSKHAEVWRARLPDEGGFRAADDLSHLATVHYAKGDYEMAASLFEQTLAMKESALGSEHPEVAVVFHNLAEVHDKTGDDEAAAELYERALAVFEDTLGPEHPQVATTLTSLASNLESRGRHADAATLLERALALRETELGPEHPDVATTLANLAAVRSAEGAYEESARHLERALTIAESKLGPEHGDLAVILNNLGNVRKATGAYDEAERTHLRARAIWQEAFGSDHPNVAVSLNNLAEVHEARREFDEAAMLHHEALEIREKALPADHPHLAYSLLGLSRVALARNQPLDAIEPARRALQIREDARELEPGLAEARFVLARALVASEAATREAIGLAEQARVAYQNRGPRDADALAIVEEWLRQQGSRRR
jgi:tetratricopeptide (TPR) repeat protein/tRNA A-37 threonylcarbamoyl transferase component Bud32